MLNILIAENIPSLNKGEETILEGMLETFKILGDVRVAMLSHHPSIDARRYSPKVTVVDLNELWLFNQVLGKGKAKKVLSSLVIILQHTFFFALYKIFGTNALKLVKAQIWREYVYADLIIIGHNGSFSIGGSGFGMPIVFYPLFVPIFSKLLNTPVALYGGTVPPSEPGATGRLKGWALKTSLNAIDLITLRDHISYANLEKLGAQSKHARVTADPAFLLPPASLNRAKEILGIEGIPTAYPLIGITVARKKAPLAYPDLEIPRAHDKHVREMARVIDHITDEHGAFVCSSPHCIGYGEELDDRIVGRELTKNARRTTT